MNPDWRDSSHTHEWLNQTSAAALSRPAILERPQNMGIETRPMRPDQFAAFIRADTEKWGEIIRRSGAKAE
jgi:tripartite-type tricarboxylate transporter receptor subunit TctC